MPLLYQGRYTILPTFFCYAQYCPYMFKLNLHPKTADTSSRKLIFFLKRHCTLRVGEFIRMYLSKVCRNYNSRIAFCGLKLCLKYFLVVVLFFQSLLATFAYMNAVTVKWTARLLTMFSFAKLLALGVIIVTGLVKLVQGE